MKKKKRGKHPSSLRQEEKERPARSFDDLFNAAADRLSAGIGSSSLIRNPKVLFPIVFLIILSFAVLLPFVGKAYHIDDPLFIWAAKQIRNLPLDPYGFQVNWYGTEQPMWQVTKNPPLVSYYLAVASFLTGWSEVGIHLAMIIFAVIAVIGMYSLSRRFCLRPLEATLASLLMPVFLVSSTTVMCDIAMLSFWIWAVVFWMEGIEKNKPISLMISACLMAAAAMTKYYGAALIPLLLAYSLMKKRALGWWVMFFLIPIGVLAAYEWATWLIYGHGLLREALVYPATQGAYDNKWVTAVVGLAFTGGCLLTAFFYIFFLWDKKGHILLGGFCLVVVFLFSGFENVGIWTIPGQGHLRWPFVIQFSLFVSLGLSILALTVLDFWTRRDENALLLFLWIFGTFVFTSFINWTVNARSILPMVPAVGILLMRRIEMHFPLKRKWNPATALIPALVVAALVTWADYSMANVSKTAAHIIKEKYSSRMVSVWFQGHWGFQYYMELLGAKPIDYKKSMIKTSAFVVIPRGTATNIRLLNPHLFKVDYELTMQPFPGCTVMQKKMGAGFYSDSWGPCPFLFGAVPPERYEIMSRQ